MNTLLASSCLSRERGYSELLPPPQVLRTWSLKTSHNLAFASELSSSIEFLKAQEDFAILLSSGGRLYYLGPNGIPLLFPTRNRVLKFSISTFLLVISLTAQGEIVFLRSSLASLRNGSTELHECLLDLRIQLNELRQVDTIHDILVVQRENSVQFWDLKTESEKALEYGVFGLNVWYSDNQIISLRSNGQSTLVNIQQLGGTSVKQLKLPQGIKLYQAQLAQNQLALIFHDRPALVIDLLTKEYSKFSDEAVSLILEGETVSDSLVVFKNEFAAFVSSPLNQFRFTSQVTHFCDTKEMLVTVVGKKCLLYSREGELISAFDLMEVPTSIEVNEDTLEIYVGFPNMVLALYQ